MSVDSSPLRVTGGGKISHIQPMIDALQHDDFYRSGSKALTKEDSTHFSHDHDQLALENLQVDMLQCVMSLFAQRSPAEESITDEYRDRGIDWICTATAGTHTTVHFQDPQKDISPSPGIEK